MKLKALFCSFLLLVAVSVKAGDMESPGVVNPPPESSALNPLTEVELDIITFIGPMLP